MLVMAECGRVLAGAPLLGHLPATALLNAAGSTARRSRSSRAASAARPTRRRGRATTSIPPGRSSRAPATGGRTRPASRSSGDGLATVDGEVAWVPDAPGADLLVVVGVEEGSGEPVAVAFGPGAKGVAVEADTAYDATRSLGHVTLDGACGRPLDASEDDLRRAWYLAQALLAAESLGAVEECLERSVAYAKERFTFGRAIGSYQAVKHALTEVLRRQENTRSLLYYAGWAFGDAPGEFAAAASAARAAGGAALDFAARELISVHGGIGATWEHDAPLFFRRAQLSRRLLGGTGDATDRLAGELLHGGATVAA